MKLDLDALDRMAEITTELWHHTTPISKDELSALVAIARAAVLTCKYRQAQPELDLLVRELLEQGMLE